jgi:hypothetical protein
MFRDMDCPAAMPLDEPVWLVLNRERGGADSEPVPAVVDEALAFRAAPATPDVPGAVGLLLFGCYLALIGALALATAGPGQSKFMLVIAGLFVVAFFAVTRFIFAQEPAGDRRPRMQRFLARGIDTFTGPCAGGAALVQMFVVPVLLTLGMLAIAVVIAFAG